MGHAGLELGNVGGKGCAGLLDGVAVGFHQRDSFRRLRREVIAAAGERSGRPLLEVGDPRKRRLQALSFRLVLRDGDGQRALGAFGGRRGVADLLVEQQESVAIGKVLLRLGRCSSHQGHDGLEHGWAPLI